MYYVENLFENHAIAHISNIYIKIALHLTSTLLNEAHESGRHVVSALDCAFVSRSAMWVGVVRLAW